MIWKNSVCRTTSFGALSHSHPAGVQCHLHLEKALLRTELDALRQGIDPALDRNMFSNRARPSPP
jgi:hypothetical protein